MGVTILPKKFYDAKNEQNELLQQIATSLGVTAGNLQDAINIANQASLNAQNKITELNENWNLLTTAQQQDAEVVTARQSTVKNKTFASLDARLEAAEQDLSVHQADYASFITNNAVAHNSIYRGKYLGSSVTAEQYLAISTGAFTDLYIGDYWTIGGVNYRIAAFDYYYNTGDTACTSHHVVIVPDTSLYTHVMNDTNITTGGYIGSKMYTEGLEQAKTTIKSVFSGHVVNHRKYLCNAVTDGAASGGAWFDSEVELMNEIMVYGSIVNGHATYGLYNIGTEKSQLPLFALNPRMINTRQSYWLRDVVSASDFARVSYHGVAGYANASAATGVRPAFSIS